MRRCSFDLDPTKRGAKSHMSMGVCKFSFLGPANFISDHSAKCHGIVCPSIDGSAGWGCVCDSSGGRLSNSVS